MAGMPVRRLRNELRAQMPEDNVRRPFPGGWNAMSDRQQLECMLGHSLTVGMEILCWGPLRQLGAAELAQVDRVRHDVMAICARFGLQASKASKAEELEELAAAIARHTARTVDDSPGEGRGK